MTVEKGGVPVRVGGGEDVLHLQLGVAKVVAREGDKPVDVHRGVGSGQVRLVDPVRGQVDWDLVLENVGRRYPTRKAKPAAPEVHQS